VLQPNASQHDVYMAGVCERVLAAGGLGAHCMTPIGTPCRPCGRFLRTHVLGLSKRCAHAAHAL